MYKTVIGIDLAATFRTNKVGIAVIDMADNDYALRSIHLVKYTKEIVSIVDQYANNSPTLLAIDSPLQLPISTDTEHSEINDLESSWDQVYTYRPWENLVFLKLKSEYGISGRPFSSLSITYRGMILKELLERQGWWRLVTRPDRDAPHCFIEVFPNLAMGIIGLEKADFMLRVFDSGCNGVRFKNGSGLALNELIKNDDQVDAIICAWTGALFSRASTRTKSAICLGDEKYGFVICPYHRRFESVLSQSPSDLIYKHEIL